MNRSKCAAATLCGFILTVGLCDLPHVQPAQAAQNHTLEVGRENPFADIPRPKKTLVPPVSNYSLPQPEPADLCVETVTLKFLDAESLKKAIQKMSSEYGSMATNPRGNSLIICDTKERLARILAEIKKADKTPRQIMIEVVIVDVQLGDDTQIGVNWDILSDKNYDIAYRQNFTARLRSTIENEETIGDATAFVTRGLGGDFSVISGTIRNVVHLIQQKREAEILASPRVMMVSGQTASIEAVEELPYTEVMDTAAGGAAALTSTEFKLVGVQLHVGATLTDSNDIFLTVDAVQNVATGLSDTEIPIVDTRKARTSLLLRDGQVVVLGGLRRQEKTKEVDQIPFIGDLPLIGELFKSTNTVVKNSELVIFLSPHIYNGEPIPDDKMAKFREIKDKPMLSLPQ
jgi:type IV pilus assembly protein PilQ